MIPRAAINDANCIGDKCVIIGQFGRFIDDDFCLGLPS